MSDLVNSLLEARKNMKMPALNGVGHAGKNGAREYKYATLQDVLKCVMPPLIEQGILLTQGFSDGNLVTSVSKADEHMVLDARHVNTSGTPQEQGSAETYAKRYALCTVFCIAGLEDDDGSMASSRPVNDGELAKAKLRLRDAINGAVQRGVIHDANWAMSGITKRTDYEENKLNPEWFHDVAREFEDAE